MNVEDWLLAIPAGRLRSPAAVPLQSTQKRNATDGTEFSEAQQLLRRVRMEDKLGVSVTEDQTVPSVAKSRWQDVKRENALGGLAALSALQDAESRLGAHDGRLDTSWVEQHTSSSDDRIEQLMASLNKAREQSEQYARCRKELREVENQPPENIITPIRSNANSGKRPVKIRGVEDKLSTQAAAFCVAERALHNEVMATSDEAPFLSVHPVPMNLPSRDVAKSSIEARSTVAPAHVHSTHTSIVRPECCTPDMQPPGVSAEDITNPLSPLDSPYYSKYMHQPGLLNATSLDADWDDPSANQATVYPAGSSSTIQKPQSSSHIVRLKEHHAPTWKYLCKGGHLRTPDAVEKVTAWLQPAAGVQNAGLYPPPHAQCAPRALDMMPPTGDSKETAALPDLPVDSDSGSHLSGHRHGSAAHTSDGFRHKELQAACDVEFCITSSGLKVARTRAEGAVHDTAGRGGSCHPHHLPRHPPKFPVPRPESAPLPEQVDECDIATSAAAVAHRKSYLISSCLDAWRMWKAGEQSRMSTTFQKAVSTMAAATTRRVLSAWKVCAIAAAVHRADETEEHCRLRVQEARKTEIASKFHRVWHLHTALKVWQAAAREYASDRAAQAHAALEEASIAARMEIAANCHNNYKLHAAMSTWRRAVTASKQERLASQQAEVVQSRIDAVLARVRAGKFGRISTCASGEHGACTDHDVAADAGTGKAVSDEGRVPGAKAKLGQASNQISSSCHVPLWDEEHAPGCSHATAASDGESEILQNRDVQRRTVSSAPVEAAELAADPREMVSLEQPTMQDLVPYPCTELRSLPDDGSVAGARNPSSGRTACEALSGAVRTDTSSRQGEQDPSQRDSSACLSQAYTSEHGAGCMLLEPKSSQVHQNSQGACFGSGDVAQPSSDPDEWNAYVEYVNRQVIQVPEEHSAGKRSHTGRSSQIARSRSARTERVAEANDKSSQAELHAQLAKVEAAAEASRKKKEEAQRKQTAQILREELRVAKEHYRISCLWRRAWRPWRMAVEARKRRLRKFFKHRQCNKMRSAMNALALHALKARMMPVLAELAGTVALCKNLAQGRQRRALVAWLQLACAMKWQRDRLQTLCWLSWQAATVAARCRRRKAKQHFHGALLRRGMKAWKAMYTQVLDQRLLLDAMAMDMAVLHSRCSLLHRSVHGWHREARNAVCERENSKRHMELWSKVNMWLQQPDEDRALSEESHSLKYTSKRPDLSETCFKRKDGLSLTEKARNCLMGGSQRPQSCQGDGGDAGALSGGASDVVGHAETFAAELEEMLDQPPRLNVDKIIGQTLQDRSRSEAVNAARAPPLDQPVRPAGATLLEPHVYVSSSVYDTNSLTLTNDKLRQQSALVPVLEERSCQGGAGGNPEVGVHEEALDLRLESSAASSLPSTKGSAMQGSLSDVPQPRIQRALREKLARVVSGRKSTANRNTMLKAVDKMHKFSKQPTFAPAVADERYGMDASSVEATPLKPTLKSGRRAKTGTALKSMAPQQTRSSEPAARDSRGSKLGIRGAHLALTDGHESASECEDEEESDDEFAWIMQRLPRL